jgi:hypothetical protein
MNVLSGEQPGEALVLDMGPIGLKNKVSRTLRKIQIVNRRYVGLLVLMSGDILLLPRNGCPGARVIKIEYVIGDIQGSIIFPNVLREGSKKIPEQVAKVQELKSPDIPCPRGIVALVLETLVLVVLFDVLDQLRPIRFL